MGVPRVPALSARLSVVCVIRATGEHSVMPKTMVNCAPSFSSSALTRCAGTVEPPEQIALTLDKSALPKLGCSIMAISMVGTPTMALLR